MRHRSTKDADMVERILAGSRKGSAKVAKAFKAFRRNRGKTD